MGCIYFLLSIVALNAASASKVTWTEVDREWMQFKKTYNRSFSILEDEYRREVWEDNVKYINRHNEEFLHGKHSYWLGVNQFTDMTWYEFQKTMTGLLQPNMDNITYTEPPSFPEVFLPEQVDWTKQGYVTPVKYQGTCGSCWAFSTTGVVEGQLKKSSGTLVSLSEQNLVDCTAKYGNKGCEGGSPIAAMKYIKDNGGIDTESCYPYTGKQGTCHYKSSCSATKISGYKVVSPSEASLKDAIATVGPISVCIHVRKTFQSYKGGVYDDPACSSSCFQLNHCVLAVGYGILSGKDYWKVKNSWGTSWGMSGYILMSRNEINQCGIACFPSYPTM